MFKLRTFTVRTINAFRLRCNIFKAYQLFCPLHFYMLFDCSKILLGLSIVGATFKPL